MERFINILIIDEDVNIRTNIKDILSGRGNNVLTVSSVEAAIPVIKRKEIGIFIINIEDSTEGLRSIKSIKDNSLLSNSYIIVVAKEDATGVKIVNGMHQGAVDCITYPLNANLIRSKIEVFKSLYFKDKRIGQLLNNIFPTAVLEEFSETGKFAPKKVEQGVVLFTDFVDFSLKAKSLKPLNLIQQLEKYFTKFDEITHKYELEKIKTIGDAYMALAGVTEHHPYPEIRACLAAIEIRNYIQTEQETAIAMQRDFWEIRIGLHMGPLVAGIIGSSKFSFDVWGDTVNIASRAEANTKNGSITITKPIFKEIDSYFNTTPRGEIDIQKRGGSIEMFYLNSIIEKHAMYGEGGFPSTDLRILCGLSPIDFKHAKMQILNRLKSLLPDDLLYHDIHHTINVEKAIIRYAKLEGIDKENTYLLRTAALFHDAGFVIQFEDNEDFGIQMAKSSLPKFGYSEEQINVIAGMINSTKISLEPKNILEEIMCDADFDYLGRPDYNVIAKKLRKEMVNYGQTMSDIEWVNYQLEFLEDTHQFYTESAINIRRQGKQQRIRKLRIELNKLTSEKATK
ncbi:MAG TPA: response regulator [Crocinitomicaceae bacterium]|nr:response regulator [Crocinitomicaceae bacterium]